MSGHLRPSVIGALRAEVLKLSRQLSLWLMLVGAATLLAVTVVATTGADNIRQTAQHDPTSFAYNMLDVFGTLFQVGSGIFLLVIGSRLFSMEYGYGTLRIIYSRGTGRFSLLTVKMLTLALTGLLLLAGYIVVVGAIMAVLVNAWTGGLGGVEHLPATFWDDVGRWELVQLLSMGMAILIAAAATGLGRTVAFAMAGALSLYPLDNFITIILSLTARATRHEHPWNDISAYLLGPNLNVVLNLIEPGHHSHAAFARPLVRVDSSHALGVIAAFAIALAAIAMYRMLRPDVLE